MSVVYLAEHDWLQRKVALKVLAPQLAEDERFRERFLRESRLAASLDHPNVIPIYEAGESGGDLFIAMRYVEGTDLRTLLHEGGALEPDRAIAILRQVAAALDAAHERGLVHRDVKPGNVLLARQRGSEAGSTSTSPTSGSTKRSASESGITGTGPVRRDARLRRRPSRSRAVRPTRGPTSTRSAASCSSASPAGRRSRPRTTRV